MTDVICPLKMNKSVDIEHNHSLGTRFSLHEAVRDARVQLVLLSICHLCALGMWNALNALGGLGTGDEELAHYCNVTGYLVGIGAGFAAGGVVNIVGMRKAALIGLTGQGLTLFSYYAYYYMKAVKLPLVVMINGVTSIGLSCLTSAIGSGIVHYPTERQRNKFIAINSIVLNLGGLLGALIALSMNLLKPQANEGSVALSRTSYLTLVIIGCSGIGFGCLLTDPEKVIRQDHEIVAIPKRKVVEEIRALRHGFTDTNLLLLVPLFLVSVWHEVVWFNCFNSKLFNMRSRAFNSCLYYTARIVASLLFQKVADLYVHLPQRVNAVTVLLLSFFGIGSMSALIVFSGFLGIINRTRLDFTESPALILAVGFLAYGALETFASSCSFWLLGVLPLGDRNVKNRYVGWYRMFINIGGTISWALDINGKVPYFIQWAINALIWLSALVCIHIVVHRTRRGPTTDLEMELSVIENECPLNLDSNANGEHAKIFRDIDLARRDVFKYRSQMTAGPGQHYSSPSYHSDDNLNSLERAIVEEQKTFRSDQSASTAAYQVATAANHEQRIDNDVVSCSGDLVQNSLRVF